MKLRKRNIVAISLVFLLVVTSLLATAQEEGTSGEENQSTVVATVNKTEITQQELSQATQIYPIIMTMSRQFRSFAQFLMTSEAGRTFLNEYQKYVLDSLIEREIQNQKMDELGIEASEADIQEQIDNIIESNDQFEDEKSLEEYIANNQNMSMDDLRSTLEDNIRRQKLREEVTGDITVTEEEVSSYYEDNKQSFTDQEGNVKPLEEVKDQIKSTLQSRKENEAWSEWLKQAKEEATIEKNLENQ